MKNITRFIDELRELAVATCEAGYDKGDSVEDVVEYAKDFYDEDSEELQYDGTSYFDYFIDCIKETIASWKENENED